MQELELRYKTAVARVAVAQNHTADGMNELMEIVDILFKDLKEARLSLLALEEKVYGVTELDYVDDEEDDDGILSD